MADAEGVGGAVDPAKTSLSPDLRQASPENLESDFGALADFITPTDQHYVRSHFAVPQVDAASWTNRQPTRTLIAAW